MAQSVEIETITPDKARDWLERNVDNRKISDTRVRELARDMQHGHWQFNGDTIRFDTHDMLLDGQHRLKAVIAAGKPIKSIVVRGLDRSVMTTIDSGRKRSMSNRLAMLGVSNTTIVAATLTMLNELAQGSAKIRLTPSEHMEAFERHPAVVTSVRTGHMAFVGTSTILSSIHYAGAVTGHRSQADAFVHVFRSGVPAWSGCPAHKARERLLKAKLHYAQGGSDMERYAKIRLVSGAWSLFLKGGDGATLNPKDTLTVDGWTVNKFNAVYDDQYHLVKAKGDLQAVS